MLTATPSSSISISPKSLSRVTCSSIASSTGKMLPLKSLSVRARLAAPAITSRSCRLAATCSPMLRGDSAATAARAGETDAATALQVLRRVGEREAAELGVEGRAQLAEAVVVEAVLAIQEPLVDPAGVGDEHGHEAGRGEHDELDVPDARAAERGVLGEGDLAGELGQEAHGAGEHVIQIDRLAEEGLDRLALTGGERTQVGELVDEDPVALVGRHPAGRGVGSRDQLLLFELRHVVADRGRRDAERMPLDDGLGAHRLARRHVVLHDDAQHGETAFGDHPVHQSFRRSRGIPDA